MSNQTLTLKTDGEIYYAIHPCETTPKNHPAAEFPCYLIRTVKTLLKDLCETIEKHTNSTEHPAIDTVQSTLLRGDTHHAFVQRGHLYVLEERQYDPHTLESEYTSIRAIGYVNASTRLIHATYTAIQTELSNITSADNLIDRICNPDNINSKDVRKIAHNPPRPTLADYGIDKFPGTNMTEHH